MAALRTDTSRCKISALEALVETLAARRASNETIIHCHGVFDLLHIGHIRHFAHAKRLGDVLVVTVTPDRYVNKGPHRPVFPEDLRAEAIAALDCVDYVAVNRWPSAVEAIELLRPDYYVKGSDYRRADADRTEGIEREELAVSAVGGKLVFTDDIAFSSSGLINRHLSVFPPEVRDYLAEFSARYHAEDVFRYLDALQQLKVLVIGEAIVDEYQYCEAIGKSSKEPMLAVKLLSVEKFAGGILAVANHVASFSDRVRLVTVLGNDCPHQQFIREKLNPRIDSSLIERTDGPTLVKRRMVENYFFTKLLEVYEMNDHGLSDSENRKLCAILNQTVPLYDVVIVVDFGHGMMTREAIEVVASKARFLAVNAQSNAANLGYHTISKYRRADYICLTEGELRIEARDRLSDLKTTILEVARRLGVGRASVTRGKNGCICYDAHEGFFEVPAFAGQVVDRIGAGDAFLAITAMCVALNTPTELVGFVGNAVGAEAVATVGNRTPIQRIPLYKHIESLLK
jgi:rfaE bifunctional protein nucleotidyltransferase chain/domain